MKRRVIISIVGCLLLGTAANSYAQDPEYKATPVTVSKDRVRQNGRLYYSHVVLEKQTLFSISKAYGVTLQDIYDSNPTLNLETEGLKTYQILLIPAVEPKAQEEPAPSPQTETKSQTQSQANPISAALDKLKSTIKTKQEDYQAKQEERAQKEAEIKAQKEKEQEVKAQKEAEARAQKEKEAAVQPVEDGYVLHTVKWFEDIDAIASKYGVSKEVIMKANGMTTPAVTRKQTLRIPVGRTAEAIAEEVKEEQVTAAAEETAAEEEKNIFETIGEAIAEKAEELLYIGKHDITAALVLPFNAQKQPSDNNLDFYSGVLLAAKDLKSEGINVDLSVYDVVGGNIPVTEEKLADCDVVLGPISNADLTKMLSLCPSRTPVISPLEPKAADLASEYANLIQAPSSNNAQCQDLVNWLKDDIRHGDKVILFTEKGSTRTASVSTLINCLEQSGIEYTTITYGLLDGRNIAGTVEKSAPADHTTRILVASESEAFVSDVVRNANLLSHRKLDIALYALSKIRSFETIEVENLHNTNLHVSISYYVDYDSPEVQRFLMQYRALFNTEPGPFAFQGYDTAYNFCKLSSQYGRHWPDKLGTFKEEGLQSNFRFTQTEAGGHTNTAVRRIVYGPDFKISLVN